MLSRSWPRVRGGEAQLQRPSAWRGASGAVWERGGFFLAETDKSDLCCALKKYTRA